MTVHVAIVSDQTLPNLIPILMERPEKVFLVASQQMVQKGLAERLLRLAEEAGVAAEIVPGLPSSGLPSIQEYALNLATRLDELKCPVVLNATGGNKLMTLGLTEVFSASFDPGRLRIIYTDTANDTLETVLPRNVQPAPLAAVLDIPTYLAAQGARCRTTEDPEWVARALARKAVTKYLAHNAEELGSLIGALNYYASRAHDGEKLTAPVQKLESKGGGISPRWSACLHELAKAGVLEWQEGSTQIRFPDLDAARYVNGFWLEEYVWHVVRDERVDHVLQGVNLLWDGTSRADAPRNELDVVAVHRNRMLVVECKTMRFANDERDGQTVITKLESLGRNAGGTFGEMLLVSARRIEDKTIRTRCRSLRIPLVQAGDLKNLRDFIIAWRDTGKLPRA